MRLSLKRLAWLCLPLASTLSFSAGAQLKSNYPYICSNGKVYSVRALPFPMAGLNLRGAFQKLQAFCGSASVDLGACVKDNAPDTLQCYREFRRRENVHSIRGQAAIKPGQIRHSPTPELMTKIALDQPSLFRRTCAPAIVALNCAQAKRSDGLRLKCLYDRSSYNARSLGRSCYSAVNAQLDGIGRLMQSHTRRTASAYANNR